MSTLHSDVKRTSRASLALPAGSAVMLALAVLLGSRAVASAEPVQQAGLPVVAVPGYHVSVFARGTSTLFNPDGITVGGGHVFVAYQNQTAKDGSDHKSSTIADYDSDGKLVRAISIRGHCDGLRFDPRTHQLWALVNNDANPIGYLIDPKTGDVDPFTFPPSPHGGGYDDLAFLGGKAFISASNPNLNAAGVNVFPAIDTIVVNNGVAQLTPVLLGNATALDTTTNETVSLNEVDPDSMSMDPAGNVVLLNQAGAEIVFLHKPGTSAQTITRIPTGTQLEDTVWASAHDRVLYVVDSRQNTIYALTANFKVGTVFTEAPSDSGVAGFVGTLDLKTGNVTPIAIGFGSPTGLLFARGDNEDDN